MASKTEITDAIEALAVHCRPPLMSVEQRLMWLRDWCADLAKFPIDAVVTGCRKWRNSESTRFPTPGQLMPLIRDSMPVEKTGAVVPWSPASPEAYRDMSVREKIREQTILAHQARTRAGPMYRNTTAPGAPLSKASGKRLTLNDMPDTYRRWTAIAESHEAEIRKLRLITRYSPAMAAE